MTLGEIVGYLQKLSDRWEQECLAGWAAKEDCVEQIRSLIKRLEKQQL